MSERCLKKQQDRFYRDVRYSPYLDDSDVKDKYSGISGVYVSAMLMRLSNECIRNAR